MASTTGPRKLKQYSEEFKLTAVKLSSLAGVLLQEVARELDMHPFMLSRWRKEVREGQLGSKTTKGAIAPQTAAELQRLRELERAYAVLKEEHALLKKALRFCSTRRGKSSRSSTAIGRNRA